MSCKKHTYVPKKTLVASNVLMLEYDKIDISEGINVNKTSASKECDILKILVLSMNHIFAMVVMS